MPAHRKPSRVQPHEDPLIHSPEEVVRQVLSEIKGHEAVVREYIAILGWHATTQEARRQGLLPVAAHPQHVALIGATGTGKTEIFKATKRALKGTRPMFLVQSTSFTRAGIVGDHVESLAMDMWEESGKDAGTLSRSLVFVDEFDKIRRSPNGEYDVGGASVQQALLGALSGNPIRGLSHDGRSTAGPFDFSTIHFTFAGAFEDGLQEIVRARLDQCSIGFRGAGDASNGTRSAAVEHVTHEDLIRYGMIRELVGRIGNLLVLSPLDEDVLVSILETSALSILKELRWQFSLHGIELIVTSAALRSVAQMALKKGLGARALNEVLLRTVKGLRCRTRELEEQDVTQIVITPEVVLGDAQPQLIQGDRRNVDERDTRARIVRGGDSASVLVSSATDGRIHVQPEVDVRTRIESLLPLVGYLDVEPAVREWLEAILDSFHERPHIVLNLIEQLLQRKPPATLGEFYWAYRRGKTENIGAVLAFMDYLRLRNGKA